MKSLKKNKQWTVNPDLKLNIKEIKLPLKSAIDKEQDRQIQALNMIDQKHDGKFAIAMFLDGLYLIWLLCLTGWMLWARG